MSGERKLIRQDLVARLMGKTKAQNRVYGARTIPLPDEALSAILVTVKRERAEPLGIGGEPNFRNTITVMIEPVVAETKDATHADKLDDLTAEIETVLLTDPEWVKQFEKIAFEEHELNYYTDASQKQIASAAMQFDLTYRTQYEPVVVDDFVTLHLDVDAIDPADPNDHPADGTWPDGYGGQPGPDNRVEVAATLTMEQDP